MASTPSDQHVIWKRVTTGEARTAPSAGPSRTMPIAYPAANSPTNNQTSGWGVQLG